MKKIAMVTGASSGFGNATARKLASIGWQLVLVARRVDRLESLKAEIGENVLECICLDVRDREMVRSKLDPWNGKVTLLINNAGLAAGLDSAWSADLDDWDAMVDTNIKGLTYVTRALLSGMVEQGKGHIVNIGSITGTYAYPGANVYGGTKAFVENFSMNLRADLHGTGVRVSNIEPGLAETEFSSVRFKGDEERAKGIYKGAQPLQPEDIAESVVWCVSQPQHVNISRLEMMPTCQSFGPLPVHREGD